MNVLQYPNVTDFDACFYDDNYRGMDCCECPHKNGCATYTMNNIRAKIFDFCGVPKSMFDASTATGVYHREVYKYMFGRYPEEDVLASALRQVEEDNYGREEVL